MQRKIWVTWQRHGMHSYGSAPDEVDYLRSKHRHLFKFKVTIEVYHEDREIEFHMFQNFLEHMHDLGVLELDGKSCEMLAEDIIKHCQEHYPGRFIEAEVSEDGECGAIVSAGPKNV